MAEDRRRPARTPAEAPPAKPAEPAESAARIAVAFASLLRGAGVDVPVGAVATYFAALGAVGLGRRGSVYWAGRTTLVRDPAEIPLYDQVFAAFWLGREPLTTSVEIPRLVSVAVAGDPDAGTEPGAGVPGLGDDLAAVAAYSPREILRHKDFASYTPEEMHEARRLMRDVRLAGALKRSRRLRPVSGGAGGGGRRLDIRRTARTALRTGGTPFQRRFLAPSVRARRVVLLCDVSGSMATYTRALLRFVHAAVAGAARVEAFTIGSRLTRVTRELSGRDPDAALAAAGRTVPDWSGGTRLGDAIGAFNNLWGVRGLARGAVVVVLSDGWDRGDPDRLAEELGRLRRVAHRIIWVNPLKASPGYEPLARGMAAALPFVDEFVEGHSLAALEHLIEVIAR